MSELLILGLIVIVGFVGRVVFKYTKIPESLLMILIGLAIGPLFGVLDQSLFMGYEGLVVAITLIIVLLDSGLRLNVFDTIKALGTAISFTLIVLLFSTLFIGVFFVLMGWEPLHALLMGVVGSGTTTLVAASLLPRLEVPEEIKRVLILESIINDVTLITAAVVVVQLIGLEALDPRSLVLAFVAPVLLAVLVGAVFTLLWVSVLWKLYRGEELAYVFTIGVLFVLYSLTELMGGNGAIAVLVLTLSLGNLPLIIEALVEGKTPLNPAFLKSSEATLRTLQKRFSEVLGGIRESQVDFAFFIQDFFFVYLGIIFDPGKAGFQVLGLCAAMIALMFVSRYVSARILSLSKPGFKPHSTLVASMVARGFTATFIALLPSTKGVEVSLFKEIVLVMVLLSNIVSIIGCVIYERVARPRRSDQD